MAKKNDTAFDTLKNDHQLFLNYLKVKYPLFHNSNFFFRDLQYGLKRYLEKKNINITSEESIKLAHKLGEFFEEQRIFVKVNKSVWKLNYPEFVTQVPGDPL